MKYKIYSLISYFLSWFPFLVEYFTELIIWTIISTANVKNHIPFVWLCCIVGIFFIPIHVDPNQLKRSGLRFKFVCLSHVTTVVAYFLLHQCQCVSKFIALRVHNLLSFQHFHGVQINIFALNSNCYINFLHCNLQI